MCARMLRLLITTVLGGEIAGLGPPFPGYRPIT